MNKLNMEVNSIDENYTKEFIKLPAGASITWQSALDKPKERVNEHKSNHEGENESMAKILACEERIKGMRFWKQYDLRAQKHYLEFLCPFRPRKRYLSSGTSSSFVLITITDS